MLSNYKQNQQLPLSNKEPIHFSHNSPNYNDNNVKNDLSTEFQFFLDSCNKFASIDPNSIPIWYLNDNPTLRQSFYSISKLTRKFLLKYPLLYHDPLKSFLDIVGHSKFKKTIDLLTPVSQPKYLIGNNEQNMQNLKESDESEEFEEQKDSEESELSGLSELSGFSEYSEDSEDSEESDESDQSEENQTTSNLLNEENVYLETKKIKEKKWEFLYPFFKISKLTTKNEQDLIKRVQSLFSQSMSDFPISYITSFGQNIKAKMIFHLENLTFELENSRIIKIPYASKDNLNEYTFLTVNSTDPKSLSFINNDERTIIQFKDVETSWVFFKLWKMFCYYQRKELNAIKINGNILGEDEELRSLCYRFINKGFKKVQYLSIENESQNKKNDVIQSEKKNGGKINQKTEEEKEQQEEFTEIEIEMNAEEENNLFYNYPKGSGSIIFKLKYMKFKTDFIGHKGKNIKIYFQNYKQIKAKLIQFKNKRGCYLHIQLINSKILTEKINVFFNTLKLCKFAYYYLKILLKNSKNENNDYKYQNIKRNNQNQFNKILKLNFNINGEGIMIQNRDVNILNKNSLFNTEYENKQTNNEYKNKIYEQIKLTVNQKNSIIPVYIFSIFQDGKDLKEKIKNKMAVLKIYKLGFKINFEGQKHSLYKSKYEFNQFIILHAAYKRIFIIKNDDNNYLIIGAYSEFYRDLIINYYLLFSKSRLYNKKMKDEDLQNELIFSNLLKKSKIKNEIMEKDFDNNNKCKKEFNSFRNETLINNRILQLLKENYIIKHDVIGDDKEKEEEEEEDKEDYKDENDDNSFDIFSDDDSSDALFDNFLNDDDSDNNINNFRNKKRKKKSQKKNIEMSKMNNNTMDFHKNDNKTTPNIEKTEYLINLLNSFGKYIEKTNIKLFDNYFQINTLLNKKIKLKYNLYSSIIPLGMKKTNVCRFNLNENHCILIEFNNNKQQRSFILDFLKKKNNNLKQLNKIKNKSFYCHIQTNFGDRSSLINLNKDNFIISNENDFFCCEYDPEIVIYSNDNQMNIIILKIANLGFIKILFNHNNDNNNNNNNNDDDDDDVEKKVNFKDQKKFLKKFKFNLNYYCNNNFDYYLSKKLINNLIIIKIIKKCLINLILQQKFNFPRIGF
ncbi:hypothetical protein M0813_07771 [Anaeramoeba flamelloides]|uniref:Uncharacterized protein n=1 Tax=Anaeramoeba flamelloides TaxID=1746091 RepID=A0ABQ8XA47_9EUKA|nr:hypothetical protein M0813_07771 [Anaeramoeba flamelloides]